MPEYIGKGNNMRVDNDCVREILLTVEKKSNHETPCCFHNPHKSHEELSKYEVDKIRYHLRYLKMANYIYVPKEYEKYPEHDFYVDLTPTGHEFLNTIRDPEVWSKTKKLSHEAGSFSLKIISAIAEGLAKGYVSTTLNLPIT